MNRLWLAQIFLHRFYEAYIHINNISKACHTSTLSFYADDTEIHSSSKNIDLAVYNVNKDLQSVRHWFGKNGLICNVKKSEAMIIASYKALKTNRDINIFLRRFNTKTAETF